MTSATSFAGMLSRTLIHMSLTARTRFISRERCRSWCEWPSKRTIKYLIQHSSGLFPWHVFFSRHSFISVYHLFWSTLYFLPLCSSKNPAFKEVLTKIEGHPDCRNLPMISFLILPMQRITRLPLLMDVSEIELHSSTNWNYKTLTVTQHFVYLNLYWVCSNHKDVSVTPHHYLIILNDLFPLSPSFNVYSFYSHFFFWPKSISSFIVPFFFSSCWTFIPLLLQSISSQGTLGVYGPTLTDFSILRKFYFCSFLPRPQYFIRLLVGVW